MTGEKDAVLEFGVDSFRLGDIDIPNDKGRSGQGFTKLNSSWVILGGGLACDERSEEWCEERREEGVKRVG